MNVDNVVDSKVRWVLEAQSHIAPDIAPVDHDAVAKLIDHVHPSVVSYLPLSLPTRSPCEPVGPHFDTGAQQTRLQLA